MTTPRKVLIDPIVPLFYHLVSRCVRRSFLCGYDRVTRRNYDHRKMWIIERLMHLGRYFAIEVHAYAIMSNHFHLVVYHDPLACNRWTEVEVADRWLAICPPRLTNGEVDILALQECKNLLLQDKARLHHVRQQLGSVSTFMKFLKQPIARRANLEDDCKGHFFEQRFYSGALLDEESVLAAMAYVDINPIRAEIAKTIEACRESSIAIRLKEAGNSPEALQAALAPLVSGLPGCGRIIKISLSAYIERLKWIFEPRMVGVDREAEQNDRWRRHVACFHKRQRAYGTLERLQEWISSRGLQRRETPLER
jgi:REP element-mobilizing transposase RayT